MQWEICFLESWEGSITIYENVYEATIGKVAVGNPRG